MKSYSESYKKAGVDITAGYRAVELMKQHIARTVPAGEDDGIGGFGGLFALPSGVDEPVLVAGTDGVGTKLRIAQLLGKHDTIGIDCVAMCVNDVLCCGARPLFFLDYIACGKNIPEKIAAIVGGVAEGCVRAGCRLIGGETAEHPGIMSEDDYDIAGFTVGMVGRRDIIDPSSMREGDVMIALPSTGLHSNGFSLVRQIFDVEHCDLNAPVKEAGGATLGDILLTPTAIYVKPMLALFSAVRVKGVSHITGGGFFENIPRSLPKGLGVRIPKKQVRVPAIFSLLGEKGGVSEHDMFNTFNMGVGMTAVLSPSDLPAALSCLAAQGVQAYALGEIVKGEGVELL